MLPSVTYVVSLCVNVLCNATFIFGLFGLPKLGVTGVALGTVIARMVEVLICLIYSLNSSDVRFRIKYFFSKFWYSVQGFYEDCKSSRNERCCLEFCQFSFRSNPWPYWR